MNNTTKISLPTRGCEKGVNGDQKILLKLHTLA